MGTSLPHYLIVGTLLGCSPTVNAQLRPAVVELFTSEGCSSCPPAEAYVGELVQRRDVLALTFHVDYWNDLGWRDRFGLPEAVKRQRAYAKSLRLSSVFTPQAVIDGRDSFVGSDRISIGRDLAATRNGVTVELWVRDGELIVDLETQEKLATSDVVLVAYQRSAISPIGRGENRGRTINEFNIVRALRTLGQWDGEKGEYRARVDSLPRDVTDVAVLIQSSGQAAIIGAASLALRELNLPVAAASADAN